MGQIVPDPVERYLSGLNRLRDPILDEIAERGREAELPLVDAEVGALPASWRSAPQSATPASGWPGRSRRAECC
jgi:hypothetical protein